jgi:hypothetical protein
MPRLTDEPSTPCSNLPHFSAAHILRPGSVIRSTDEFRGDKHPASTIPRTPASTRARTVRQRSHPAISRPAQYHGASTTERSKPQQSVHTRPESPSYSAPLYAEHTTAAVLLELAIRMHVGRTASVIP